MTIPASFGWWLAGFIDGEGNFDIHRQRRPSGDYFYCRFDLCLRADDREVLLFCQGMLGGKVYPGRAYTPTSHPKIRWEMVAREECRRLALVLTEYPLQSKKARDFATWKEALEVSTANAGTNRADLMLPFWQALRAGREFA